MIPTEIEHIIARVLDGEASKEESERLELWLQESPEHHKAFDELKHVRHLSTFLAQAPSTDTASDLAALQKRMAQASAPVRRQRPPVFALAASILLLAVAGYFLFFYPGESSEHPSLYSSAQEVNIPANLSDGSEIRLNANSQLAVLDGFNEQERRVSLKGEAFFEVASNAKKPFIIEAGIAQVKVIGTSFNVFAPENSREIRVAVATGMVEVRTKSDTKVLSPDQIAFLDTQNGLIRVLKAAAQNETYWKDSTLTFSASPIREVIATLNRTFQTQVELGPGLDEEQITATFEKKDIPTISEAIALSIGAQTESKPGSILIKR